MASGILRTGMITAIIVAALATTAVYSQPLRGRSEIEVGFGYKDNDVFDNIDHEFLSYDRSEFKDIYFRIGFNHWLAEDLAFNIMLSALADETYIYREGYYNDREEMAVISIYYGIRYYFAGLNRISSIRPYFALSAGPVLGTKEDFPGSSHFDNRKTAAAFGGYFGTGIDIQVSHRIMLGISGGYNAITDFDEPIGGKDNFGGAEFGVSFGLLLGRGRY